MIRGRKPKPTLVHQVHGNPGNRPLNDNEPKLETGPLEPPDFLDAYGLEEWRRVEPMLTKSGLVTQGDLAALVAYCDAWGNFRKAVELRAQAGPPIIEGSNGVLKENPVYRMVRLERREVIRYAAELGITPSARSRVDRVQTPTESENERHFRGNAA